MIWLGVCMVNPPVLLVERSLGATGWATAACLTSLCLGAAAVAQCGSGTTVIRRAARLSAAVGSTKSVMQNKV